MADHDNAFDTPRKPLTAWRRSRFFLEWLFVATVAGYVRLWPRRAAVWGGGVVGSLAYLALGSDRRVARENLDLALGDAASPAEKRRLARRAFRNVGRVVFGMFWAPRLSPADAADLVDTAELAAVLHGLATRGRGVVLVTAHYGEWELACVALAHAGFPMLMVTEPLANPRLGRLFDRMRTCSGNKTIPPKYAALKLFRALRRGERAAVMCDVNGRRGRGGVWVDFFGLPVFNATAMAELALRTRAAVVFAGVVPVKCPGGGGGRYRMEPFPTVEPNPEAERGAEVRRVTQQVIDHCADLVRRDPEPFLWTNKRWKRRPTADRGRYPSYSNYKRVE